MERGARRLLGYESGQVVGHPVAHLLADAPGESTRPDTPGQDRWSGSVVVRHHNGSRLRLRLLASRRPHGDPAGDWLLVSAVTPRPSGPQETALAEWAFTHSPCGLAVFDTDRRLVQANAAMERAAGFTQNEMRGLRLPEIAPHPLSEEADRRMRQALETGEPQYLQPGILPAPAPGPQPSRPASLAPVKDADGRVRAVCLAAHHPAQEPPARQYTLLLKDAGARIGTTPDIARTAQELADAAVPPLADFTVVELLDDPRTSNEAPSPVGLTLRRTAVQSILDHHPESPAPAGRLTTYPPPPPSPSAWPRATAPVTPPPTPPSPSGWARTPRPPRSAKRAPTH